MIKLLKIPSLILFAIIILSACTTDYNIKWHYKDKNQLLHSPFNKDEKNFAKIHMKDGRVYLLNTPLADDKEQKLLIGNGELYDWNRKVINRGNFKIPADSIALIECNKVPDGYSSKYAAGVVFTIVDIGIGILCLTNPKACFGSCPTFYYNDNDDLTYSEAEGFSSAIVPSMEYTDIDALNNPTIKDQIFSITMKNEALETHAINQIKVLAFPRKSGESIFHSTNDEFFATSKIYDLKSAYSNEGDITSKLQKMDRIERYSLADEENMSSKEEIILNFENINKTDKLGLLLNFRQSLMTTYLIYSALSYMGDECSDLLYEFDKNSGSDKLKQGIYKELGDIDIYLFNKEKNDWQFQGSFYETGPIAFNKQILPFKNINGSESAKIKLILNKGYWRLDYVALAKIKEKVTPLELSPIACYSDNKVNDEALKLINNGSNHLNTFPGDKYKFHFLLPEKNTDYELFLSSRGYYLEWIRKDWLKEKDLYKLYQLVNNPKTYLKNEASNYKIYEKTAEENFWNSKIKSKLVTQNEK